MNVRQGQWDRFISIMFLAINATPVTHSYWLVSSLHILFTGLGAFGFFIALTHYFKKWSMWWWVFLVLAILGFLSFIVGYKTNLYNTAMGEWLYALAAIIFLIKTNLKRNEKN